MNFNQSNQIYIETLK